MTTMSLLPFVMSSRDQTLCFLNSPSFRQAPSFPITDFSNGCRFFPAANTQTRSLNFSASAAAASPRRIRTAIVCSGETHTPAKALRQILESPGVHQGPACFDALSARLVERAGFQYCFTSGFSISAARLGLPDTGFISYGEMVDQGQQITQAVSIPVIGDGDNGYGNAMNVKRTVKGYIRAGFAGIILEDQISPKACGHTRGRKVVSREEAVLRIRAAVDARKESGSDILIVARTDSRQALSFEESLWRSRAFAEAGADVLFIDALASKEEMRAFCEVSPLVPKMANMLEGGGKTPILNPLELEALGYKLVAYPLSLLGVSIQAMQDALTALKGGRIPRPGSMPSFEEIKEILGFNAYYEEEKRYATGNKLAYSEDVSSDKYSIQKDYQDYSEPKGPQNPTVEVITPEVYNPDGRRNPFNRIWNRTLRIKITGRDGFEKLDVRIPGNSLLYDVLDKGESFLRESNIAHPFPPETSKLQTMQIHQAGFLEGVTNIVPALGGVNLKGLLDDAAEEVGGKLLLDFNDNIGDRIQVFLE